MSDEAKPKISQTQIEENLAVKLDHHFERLNDKVDLNNKNLNEKVDSIKRDLREDNQNSEHRVTELIRHTASEQWKTIDENSKKIAGHDKAIEGHEKWVKEHDDQLDDHETRIFSLEGMNGIKPDRQPIDWMRVIFGKGGIIALVVTALSAIAAYFGLK